MSGEVVQLKALLREGPLPPRTALQIIISICEAAATPSALVPGGRPLSAGAILLSAEGTATLQEVGEVDSLSVGALLAQLLLGQHSAAPPPSTEQLLTSLDQALQQPEIDRDQRHALLTIVRACHSPTPEGRPPLHRIQRRCQDLLPSAAGTPLGALLKRRQAPRDQWMDLHEDDVSEEIRGLGELLQQKPPPTAAPPPAPATTTATAAPSREGTPPTRGRGTPPPSPRGEGGPALPLLLVLGVAAVVVLALGGGYYARRHSAAESSREAVRGRSTPVRVEGIIDRYGAPEGRTLTLLSVPEGAAVAVDGVALGTTPLEGLTLDAGVHHIHLKGADKAELEQAVMVDRDARCTWEPAATEGEPWRCESL